MEKEEEEEGKEREEKEEEDPSLLLLQNDELNYPYLHTLNTYRLPGKVGAFWQGFYGGFYRHGMTVVMA